MPAPLQNLWHYHASIYAFHIGLTPRIRTRPPPPLAAHRIGRRRMFWDPASTSGGTAAVRRVRLGDHRLPNPLIWYAAWAAAVYLLVRLIRRREWQAGLLLVAIAAG